MRKISKVQIQSIVCLIFTIGLIYSFNTIYIAQNFLYVYIVSTIMCFISIMFAFIWKNKYRLGRRKLTYVFAVLLLNYLYVLLRVRSLYGGLILGVAFPVFFLFVIFYDNYIEKIFEMLVTIAAILAIISLGYWVFGSLFNIIHPRTVVDITWGYSYTINKYSIFYYTPQNADLFFMGKHIGVRNCSIFAEAPMASAFYSIALVLNDFYIKKKPLVLNSIFAITIISTLSVTGWIILVLFAVYKVMKYEVHSRTGKVCKILFVLIAACISVGLVYSLISRKLATGSGADRSYRIAMEWSAFLKNPLIGWGFNSYTKGSSNSLISLLADGGILLLILYYFPIAGVVLLDFVREKKINWFMVFFAGLFVMSVIQYTFLIVFLIAFSWKMFIDKICARNDQRVGEVWSIRQIY